MSGTPRRKWAPSSFKEGRDLARLLALRERVFRKQQAGYDENRWRWQFARNPAGKPFIELAVGADDAEIVAGHYSIVPQHLSCRGQTVWAGQSLDPYTNPDFERQGIFKALAKKAHADAKDANFEVIFGFPNAQSAPVLTGPLEMESPFELRRYVLPLHAGYFLKRIPGLKILAALGEKFRVAGDLDSAVKDLTRVEAPTEAWVALSREVLSQFVWTVDRPLAYWNWRYRDCPDRKYEFYELKSEKGLQGVVVTHLGGPKRPGHIVDFIARRPRYWQMLLRGAAGILSSQGAESATTLLHDANPVVPQFKAIGFQPREAVCRFVVKELRTEETSEELLEPPNWFLTPGDTDLF